MEMMDGERRSGDSSRALRGSYKVNCEKYLADHHYYYQLVLCNANYTVQLLEIELENRDHL